MTFRALNQKYFAPGAQTLMILGIISLCQPWSLFLHNNGLMLTLIGLIAFIVTSKIAPDPEAEEEDDEFETVIEVLEIGDEVSDGTDRSEKL